MKINDKIDFTDTMNLPKKTISTDATLTKKESFFLAKIQDVSRYRAILYKNKLSNKVYDILENPMVIKKELDPTYIQNKILKDVLIRYRLLGGYKVAHNLDFIHIDDMLETQKENTQKLQELIKKRDIRKKDLTELVKKQVQQIKDLGTVINYSNFNSSTLNPEFESRIIEKFWKLYKQKKIYHDLRPVNWCTKCKRALENNNIIREEEKVDNIFLLFNLKDDNQLFSKFNNLENTYFVASTIRPWILDFDNNLAVVENIEYSLVEVKQKDKNIHYIIASEFVPYIMEKSFYIKFDIKMKVLGKELIGMKCLSALDKSKDLNVIATKREYVVLNEKQSSGVSIISSGNTYVDYLISKENPIVVIKNNLTKDGNTTLMAYNFKNVNYKESNDKILNIIKDKGKILCKDIAKIKMPKCAECNSDVIYRNEQEWYIKKDIEEDKLRQIFDNIISKLSDCKDYKKNNIRDSLYESLKTKEMIISNESAFGTPIPVFYCGECSSEVINDKVISIIEKLFKNKGIESWYKETPEEILQGQVACDKCGCSFLFKGTTTLNEFFKSMCIPIVNPKISNDNDIRQINLCIENQERLIKKIKELSFDESSLDLFNLIERILLHPKIKISDKFLKSKANKAENLNSKNKNSKSKKEVKTIEKHFDMQEVVKKYGTDVLRLWCVQKSNSNIADLSNSSILYTNKMYKQIRRTLKFLLSNLYDFNPSKDMLSIEKRDDLDKYIYVKLKGMLKEVKEYYDDLNLYKVYMESLKFCNETLCNEYFNVIKFRLYVLNQNDIKRRSTQSTLYEIFMGLLLILEPILPFTFEETWSYIWHTNVEEENNLMLYRENLKKINVQEYENSIKKWNNIFFIIGKVNLKIKSAIKNKQIKDSFQAKVTLCINERTKAFIDENHEDFLRALNVSELITKLNDKSAILIEKAEGFECKRCKNYSVDIGQDIKYRYLCPVCAKIMNERKV